MTNKVTNATKWSVLAEVTAKIAAPIVNMILARLLAPEAYGVVASITIITSFADIFTDAGFQKYVIQKEYDSIGELNDNSNVAFTANLSLSSIIYLLIFVFRKQLANAVGNPEAANGLAVAALAVLCTSFSSIVIARFRRDLEFKPLFCVRLGSSLVPLIVTVPLAFILRSYWALVIGTVSQQAFIAIAVCILSKYKPKILVDFTIFKKMLSFSLWNLCETLSIWFAGQANIFIVARVLDSYYLGLYRTGMTTINSYMALFTSAITPVLFSSLSRAQDNAKEYMDTFNKFQKMLALAVVPMGVGICLYRKLAVQILLGNSWREVTDFMGLWALVSSLTIVFSNMASEVYRSKGKPQVSFYIQVAYLLVYVPAIYISAKAGFDTLSVVSCLIRLLPIAIDIVVLDRVFKVKFIDVVKNVGYTFFAVFCMSLVAIALNGPTGSVLRQIVTILVCIVIYMLIIVLNGNNRTVLMTFLERRKNR